MNNGFTQIVWLLAGMTYAFSIAVFVVSDTTESWILCILGSITVIAQLLTVLIYSIKTRKRYERDVARAIKAWDDIITALQNYKEENK